MIFAAVMMCSCGIYTKYEPQTSVPDNLYGDSLSYGTDTASLGNVYWRELFTDTLYSITSITSFNCCYTRKVHQYDSQRLTQATN